MKLRNDKRWTVKSPTKLKPTSCLISGLMALALRISRPLGMAPLVFEKKERHVWRIRVAPWVNAYSYLDVCILTAYALDIRLVILDDKSASLRMFSPITRTAFTVVVVLTMAASSVAVFGAVARIRHLVPHLAEIEQIICQVSQGRKRDLAQTQGCVALTIWLMLLLIMVTYSYIHYYLLSIHAHKNMFINTMYVCHYAEIYLIQVLDIYLIAITVKINEAYHCVNDAIRDLVYIMDLRMLPKLSNSDDWPMSYIDEPMTHLDSTINDIADVFTVAPNIVTSAAQTFRRLALRHGRITDINRSETENHRVCYLLSVALRIINIIEAPYRFILIYSDSKARSSTLIIPGVQFFFNSLSLILLVEPAYRTSKQVWNTQILTGQLLRRVRCPHDPLVREVEVFMKDIEINRSFLSNKYTRTFVAAVFGSITSYVVMILTVQQATPLD